MHERTHDPSNIHIIPAEHVDETPETKNRTKWENYFYTHLEKKSMPCPFCDRLMVVIRGNFRNFDNHLKSRHKNELKAGPPTTKISLKKAEPSGMG